MPVISLDEAAQALRLSRSTVERLIKANVLPVLRVGRRVLVRRSDLEALVARGADTGHPEEHRPAGAGAAHEPYPNIVPGRPPCPRT